MSKRGKIILALSVLACLVVAYVVVGVISAQQAAQDHKDIMWYMDTLDR